MANHALNDFEFDFSPHAFWPIYEIYYDAAEKLFAAMPEGDDRDRAIDLLLESRRAAYMSVVKAIPPLSPG